MRTHTNDGDVLDVVGASHCRAGNDGGDVGICSVEAQGFKLNLCFQLRADAHILIPFPWVRQKRT